MINNHKLAVVTVWYNPTEEVIDNIMSYGSIVDKIYCVDNSDVTNEKYVNDDRIDYIPLRKNTGIATALNIGCQKSIEDGNDIIITFDQDTFCADNTVEKLAIRTILYDGDVIVAPRIKYIFRKNEQRIFSDEVVLTDLDENPQWVITSGSTFKSSTFIKTHGFDEKLFISQVDQDFCFRIKTNGGEIVRLSDAYIWQEPGKTETISFLGKTLHIPNLTASRYYYIFRNEFYLREKWGREYKHYWVKLYKYTISILFFENSKLEKIRACIKGVKDVREM